MLRLKENFPKPFEQVAQLLECGCPSPGDHFEGDSGVIFRALESSAILLSDVKYLKNLIFRPKESGAVVFSWLLRASKGTAASLERGPRGRAVSSPRHRAAGRALQLRAPAPGRSRVRNLVFSL